MLSLCGSGIWRKKREPMLAKVATWIRDNRGRSILSVFWLVCLSERKREIHKLCTHTQTDRQTDRQTMANHTMGKETIVSTSFSNGETVGSCRSV